jgi:DNA-binding phage protein
VQALLQNALERQNLLFIVGTGYSAASSGGAALATWQGLVHNGIDRALMSGAKPTWADHIRGLLEYGFSESDMTLILAATTAVVEELGKRGDYVYPKWLQETVGKLAVVDPALGKAIRSLPFPILTTNYDTLLENRDRRATDWTKPSEMLQVISGAESRDIGHLHGVWSNPASVIFTAAQYRNLLESEVAQNLQRAASTLKSLVYIGYGAGLDDPNFESMINWHRQAFVPSPIPHFRLCLNSQLVELEAAHLNDHIIPVAYGDLHEDLPAFLARFSEPATITLSSAGLARDIVGEVQTQFSDDMKTESIIGDVLDDVDELPVGLVVRPPVLLPVAHSEYIKARSVKGAAKIERVDPHEEIKQGEVVVIAAEENTGLTTAVKWLALEASNYISGASPIYVPFASCRKLRNPLLDAVHMEAQRHQLTRRRADALPPLILALDSFSPYVDQLSELTLKDIRELNALYTIIGCAQGAEEEVVERLERIGVKARVRYIGKLNAADIREYARLASPTNYKSLAQQVLSMLQSENLARTPFTVSLLLSVLIQGGKFAANASQTSILDDYIGLMLGRGDPHDDARFGLDQVAREALLGNLAQAFVEAGAGGMSEIAVQATFQATFDRFDWSESTAEVLSSFIDRRILRRRGNHVEFARSSFLHMFAAKRATVDTKFRDLLLSRPLYYSDAITDYAALFRHDADLLERLGQLLTVQFDSHETFSVLEPVALTAPRLNEADEGDSLADDSQNSGDHETQGSSAVAVDEGWKDELFDSADDLDLPPFPTVHENEVPQALQLLRTLELVSTVLRDSDQIEDLQLKHDVLAEVLAQWAVAMDVMHEDSSFIEFVQTLVEDLEMAKADKSDEKDVVQELSKALPAAIVLNGVGSNLASRKLIRLVERVGENRGGGGGDTSATVVMSCFFYYSLEQRGWPRKIADLIRDQGNLWIVRNFMLHLFVYDFEHDVVHRDDREDLLQLCMLIIQQAVQYKDEPERRRHGREVNASLTRRRLEARTRTKLSAATISQEDGPT